MHKVAFGLDLAGYSTGKSGFAWAVRYVTDMIEVTVFVDHIFEKIKKSHLNYLKKELHNQCV